MRFWMGLSIGLLACNGKDDAEGEYSAEDIEDQTLQGKINGEDWTFEGGITDNFLSDDEEFFGVLFGENVDDACNFGFSDGPEILLGIPTEEGEYEFTLTQNGTFTFDNGGSSENLVATDGFLVVDEVTDTEVSGGVIMEYDDDNQVNGTFTLSVCPEDDF